MARFRERDRPMGVFAKPGQSENIGNHALLPSRPIKSPDVSVRLEKQRNASRAYLRIISFTVLPAGIIGSTCSV